jgi:HSP20 family protein
MAHAGKKSGIVDPLASDLLGSAAMEQNFFGMGGWFPSGLGADVPKANVSETDQELMIELAVPGLERKDFKVEVIGHKLQVSVKREAEGNKAIFGYARREYSYDSFVRSFSLPDNFTQENINATYERGILKVSIPKQNSVRKILVR